MSYEHLQLSLPMESRPIHRPSKPRRRPVSRSADRQLMLFERYEQKSLYPDPKGQTGWIFDICLCPMKE